MVGKQSTLHTGDGMLHSQGVCETTPNQIFKYKVERLKQESSSFFCNLCSMVKDKINFIILLYSQFNFPQDSSRNGRWECSECSWLNILPCIYSVHVRHFWYCPITTMSQCLPVVHYAMWLTSVKCLCSLLLSSGEDVCSTVDFCLFCFVFWNLFLIKSKCMCCMFMLEKSKKYALPSGWWVQRMP